MGAEGAGGSIPVEVGRGSQRPPTVTCGGATGQVETTWVRGGPGPGRRSQLVQNNTLNKILVFDMSLAIGLYALTNYTGTVMGTRRCSISRILHDFSD